MLNREQVHKVALLARLELTPAEEEQYAGQMSSIIDYFEQLSELDTTGIEPTTRAIDMSNIDRHDSQSSYQNLTGIYEAAPDRDVASAECGGGGGAGHGLSELAQCDTGAGGVHGGYSQP